MTAATAAALFVAVHGDVTDLTAGTKGARDDLAVYDHAATDTRTDGHEYEVADVFCRTMPQLSERRGIRIVHKGELRTREGTLQRPLQTLGIEVDVWQHAHPAVIVYGSWYVEADAHHVIRRGIDLCQKVDQPLRHNGKRDLVHELARGNPGSGLQFTLGGKHARLYAGTTDVYTQYLVHVSLLSHI